MVYRIMFHVYEMCCATTSLSVTMARVIPSMNHGVRQQDSSVSIMVCSKGIPYDGGYPIGVCHIVSVTDLY